MPPRVDFYVSGEAGENTRLRLACRVTEKAYLARQRILVWTDEPALLPRFDELLWTFGDGSFVPHDTLTGPGAECPGPVALTTGALPADSFFEGSGTGAAGTVLINLGQAVPPFFARFSRVAEFLDARPEVRSAGRDRFKHYRGQSIEPHTHNL
jgi:DNA polymerase-3 subunit chi